MGSELIADFEALVAKCNDMEQSIADNKSAIEKNATAIAALQES